MKTTTPRPRLAGALGFCGTIDLMLSCDSGVTGTSTGTSTGADTGTGNGAASAPVTVLIAVLD